jgi:stage III sporulation protein AG
VGAGQGGQGGGTGERPWGTPGQRPPRWVGLPFHLKAPEWRTAAGLGLLLAVGLLLLTAARTPSGPGRTGPGTLLAGGAGAGGEGSPAAGGPDPLAAEEAAMDRDLEAALRKVAGAGEVTVRVRLAAGPRTEYQTDTQETDSATSQTAADGAVQSTTQRSVSHQLPGGSGPGGGPPVVGEQAPQVGSVLVVATGATSAVVRERLATAAAAATGAPLYAVTVLPAEGGG